MMRFDKPSSNRAAAPQLGDKNGNFDQKNDFSALDHFFCTLCHFYILDFVFSFLHTHYARCYLTDACFKLQVSGVSRARMLTRYRRMSQSQIVSHFAHSASGALAKNIKRRFFKNRLQAKISYHLLKRNN